jgi:hypothetical protein
VCVLVFQQHMLSFSTHQCPTWAHQPTRLLA